MKNKGVKAALVAAGAVVVLAGVTAAIWASAGQPDPNMSSYVAKTPVEPSSMVEETKPPTTGQYAARNRTNAEVSAVEDGTIRPFAGMTDEQVEAALEQYKTEDPEGAKFLNQYWIVYKVIQSYRPGSIDRDHIFDENKNDVVGIAIDLYNSGDLEENDKETITWFIYDQINCLAGASSSYYDAAKQIADEYVNRSDFVPNDHPAS